MNAFDYYVGAKRSLSHKNKMIGQETFPENTYSKKKMTLSTDEMQEENLVQAMTLLT